MSTTERLEGSPIPSSIENAGDWEAIARQIASQAGLPPVVTPDVLAGMIASAIPLLFEADAANNMNLLRGTFADQVIAQCQRNAGCLMGARPTSAVVHLVGPHLEDGHPVLRAHISVQVEDPNGSQSVSSQFWDVQLEAQVTVEQASCPNCGAPLGKGELICGHCGTDVRTVSEVPLLVSRVELY
jgi:ribosomal protein S27AE